MIEYMHDCHLIQSIYCDAPMCRCDVSVTKGQIFEMEMDILCSFDYIMVNLGRKSKSRC